MTDPRAIETCNTILSFLRKSGLNFIVQETPYSAYITIRKKFCSGFVVNSTVSNNDNDTEQKLEEVEKLEKRNNYLKNELEETLELIENIKSEKEVLQKRLENAEKETFKQFKDAKSKELKLIEEISDLKQINKKCEKKISELNLSKSEEEKQADTLEKTIFSLELRNSDLLVQSSILKGDKNNNKGEDDSVRKVKKSNAKISEPKAATPPRAPPGSPSPPMQPTRLESPHTPPGLPPSSSLDSVQVTLLPNPTKDAKFSRKFLLIPSITPCLNRRDHCTHSSQCILREPLPPPFPSITFLYNENTQYHMHMMQWSKKEFAGCAKCFSIENENYGCKDCRWLKFWYGRHGETHGFPDISTWTYKKYL